MSLSGAGSRRGGKYGNGSPNDRTPFIETCVKTNRKASADKAILFLRISLEACMLSCSHSSMYIRKVLLKLVVVFLNPL